MTTTSPVIMAAATIAQAHANMFPHLDESDIAVLRLLGEAVALVDSRRPSDNTVRALIDAIDSVERGGRSRLVVR